MKLTELLSEDRIIPRLEARDRASLLRELVVRGQLAVVSDELDADALVEALESRERVSSTGLKDGLAIPHAKVKGLTKIIACMGVTTEGIPFGALDDEDSKVFIALLTPESARGLHLKALARIARIFAGGVVLNRILELSETNGNDASALMLNELKTEDARY